MRKAITIVGFIPKIICEIELIANWKMVSINTLELDLDIKIEMFCILLNFIAANNFEEMEHKLIESNNKCISDQNTTKYIKIQRNTS